MAVIRSQVRTICLMWGSFPKLDIPSPLLTLGFLSRPIWLSRLSPLVTAPRALPPKWQITSRLAQSYGISTRRTKKSTSMSPGKPVMALGIDDVLDGGKVLPGFKLAVKDIFPSDE